MTPEKLRIIYADGSSDEALGLVRILTALGHAVERHERAEDALAASEPDAYVVGRSLSGGRSGLELLQALRRGGRRAPILLVDEKPSFDEMRRAVELGANDMLLVPFGTDDVERALQKALETTSRQPRIDREPRDHSFQRSYPATPDSVGRSARELSAYLLNEGVVSAHRVRIASALAELVDNAARHAYPNGEGEITVGADVRNARVLLSVVDSGRGFDAPSARLERVPAALPGRPFSRRRPTSSTGLGRVERLCETHAVESGPGGTAVELSFQLTPVRFDEESELSADTDFLDPARAHSLVAALSGGSPDLSGLPPSMVLTVGRIIGGIERTPRPSRG